MKKMVFLFAITYLMAPPSLGSEYSQNDCDIDCMKELALSGDQGAARQLSIIYGKIDLTAAKHWHLIGAENGDPIAQYNYAIRLIDEGTAESKKRAVFWLKKSAASGDKEAKELLSRVENNLPLIPPPP